MTVGLDYALLAFVLVSAVVTALLRDILGSIIAFGAYSLGMAVVWVFLRAPDVGLTEAAVGAGVMTVLLLLTIAKTVRPPGEANVGRIDVPSAVVALLLVAALSTTLVALPPVGTGDSPPANDGVTRYYIENSHEETGVKNIVTAVLAAYRGFDTMGEAVVVFSAGVGILLVLGREAFG